MKRIVELLLIVLSLSSLAYAAEEIEIKCDSCDLRSVVLSGPIKAQVKLCLTNTVMYCTKCKDFFSIETGFTENNEEAGKPVDFDKLKKIEKGEFASHYIGDEPVFWHPKCNGRACIYYGKKCPKCSQGMLKSTGMADVD